MTMGLFDFFKKPYQSIQATQVSELQAAGAMLVDVREPGEYRMGHVAGAKLVPLGQLERSLKQLPKERQIIVMCQSGMRSQQAASILAANGYSVLNVSGGIVSWRRANLPLIK